MKALVMSSSLLFASVAQADDEGLLHYSASVGTGKAYSDAGIQLEFGAGPISLFGATGYQWSQDRANFAAGLKGWLDERRWSANAQFQWSSVVPAQTLEYGIDRAYTLSFGLARRIQLRDGFFVEGAINIPWTCARYGINEDLQAPTWFCNLTVVGPDEPQFFPDLSMGVGLQLDALERASSRAFTSPFDASLAVGLIADAVAVAALFVPTYGVLYPLTVAILVARPVLMTVAAVLTSGRPFDLTMLVRGAGAALIDYLSLALFIAPVPHLGGLGGTALRVLATPHAASWGLTANAPALAIRF